MLIPWQARCLQRVRRQFTAGRTGVSRLHAVISVQRVLTPLPRNVGFCESNEGTTTFFGGSLKQLAKVSCCAPYRSFVVSPRRRYATIAESAGMLTANDTASGTASDTASGAEVRSDSADAHAAPDGGEAAGCDTEQEALSKAITARVGAKWEATATRCLGQESMFDEPGPSTFAIVFAAAFLLAAQPFAVLLVSHPLVVQHLLHVHLAFTGLGLLLLPATQLGFALAGFGAGHKQAPSSARLAVCFLPVGFVCWLLQYNPDGRVETLFDVMAGCYVATAAINEWLAFRVLSPMWLTVMVRISVGLALAGFGAGRWRAGRTRTVADDEEWE